MFSLVISCISLIFVLFIAFITIIKANGITIPSPEFWEYSIYAVLVLFGMIVFSIITTIVHMKIIRNKGMKKIIKEIKNKKNSEIIILIAEEIKKSFLKEKDVDVILSTLKIGKVAASELKKNILEEFSSKLKENSETQIN